MEEHRREHCADFLHVDVSKEGTGYQAIVVDKLIKTGCALGNFEQENERADDNQQRIDEWPGFGWNVVF